MQRPGSSAPSDGAAGDGGASTPKAAPAELEAESTPTAGPGAAADAPAPSVAEATDDTLGSEGAGTKTSRPTSDAPPPPPPAVDTSTRKSELYGERLDALEADVTDLKDRIFRSKARLALLKETVLHGVMAGSRVIMVHRNVMGAQFRLVEIKYSLDGAQIFARRDESTGALDEKDEIVVFDGNLVPGPHTLTVELTYKGRGFGAFAYLNGYTFEARSSHTFTAPENGAIRLMSVGFEKGNLTTEMRDRPAVDWQTTPLDASGKPKAQPAKASGAATASGSGSARGG